MEIVAAVALILVGLVFWAGLFIGVAYVFALYEFCFTLIKEGTAVAIMRGKTFDHYLMAYRGHYLNDPRRKWFDPNQPAWEMLQSADENEKRSAYSRGSLWRIPERYGIYWYGLWPLYDVDQYRFRWSEEKTTTNGAKEQWVRDELTKIMFVSTFVYWVKLEAAEDQGNIPVDLDYLLSVRINNPYKARFTVTNWLDLLTADTNNAAKMWVGSNTFEQIVREKSAPGAGGFSAAIDSVNTDLPTFGATIGAPKAFGATVVATSLQQVAVAGRNQEAIVAATTAQTIAERNANARRAVAQGEADAIRTLAEAETNRIDSVYAAVARHGDVGVAVQQFDAIRAAAQSPGATVVWANDPIVGAVGSLMTRRTASTPPVPPPVTPPTTP